MHTKTMEGLVGANTNMGFFVPYCLAAFTYLNRIRFPVPALFYPLFQFLLLFPALHRKHGAEGHDFDQQFGFHALVIINETFIGVFVYFGRILFIVEQSESETAQADASGLREHVTSVFSSGQEGGICHF